MHQPGNWAGHANHASPSTTSQPLQCRHKTAPLPHPPNRQLQPSTRPRTIATKGSIEGRPPLHAKDRAPRQPHTQTPEVPQHAGHTHSCTTPSLEPSGPPTDGLGTEARDRDPRKSKRFQKSRNASPAPDNPQDPNPNPSPDPDQKARSFSRPPTPNGKQ
ncbi:hypothetical protein CRENBAI_000521 [Crenichthys baileyi]|uniref:Uncharacterized protein n=1 Tax=Crenichthys baileyi TaxID=28760 RepID=A0AAV9S6U8_9TELE